MRRQPDRLFLLTGGAQGFALACGLPAVVWWVVELQLSPLRLALLGTALVATILVAETPTGVLADLYGRKPAVVASFALMGGAMGLMATSPAFGAMIAWQAVWAVGWAMQSGAATAWVTDELAANQAPTVTVPAPDDAASGRIGGRRKSDTGPGNTGLDQLIVRHAAWRAAGLMVGLVLNSAVGVWSLRGAMVTSGTISLALGAYLAAAMAETGFERGRGRPDAGAAFGQALAIWRQGAALVLHTRRLRGVVAAAVIAGFATEAIERLDTLRITQLGLSDFDGGEAVVFFGAAWFVMAALSLPVMAWLRHRLGRPDPPRDARLLARLLVVAGLGALALAISPVFALAIGGWAVLDVAGETAYPLAEAMANREASTGVRATVISFLGQAEALGQVAGGVGLGLLAQLVSVPVALASAAGLLGVAAIPVIITAGAGPGSHRSVCGADHSAHS